MEKELIHLEHVSKTYDGHKVLDGLDLAISENEFVTLLGPSGCGKTTTLRLIAGFETPDEGRILFDGADITQLPPNRRQVNTVFQNYSLFSHMDVAENIAFGPKIHGKSRDYIRDKIRYALKRLVKGRVLTKGQFNESRFDRTNWYAFTEFGQFLMTESEGRTQ